ncbi:pyruvate kinase [Buchnera aphidicola]|uniref:pyruvate kinase n=1 Tax=Buchnera aphidicola TaxID=9 RepID=UPI0034644F22
MLNQKIRRTKIVATLGPSTDKNNILEKIILSGANVLRLNFSHGNSEEHEKRAYHALKVIKKTGFNIALLGDLQGPKIRISTFRNNFAILIPGHVFLLDSTLQPNEGNENQVGIDYKKLPLDVNVDDILLLDDGRIQLKIIKVNTMQIFTRIIVGGKLSNNKGINKLGGGLSAISLTNKDKSDILLAAKIGVDYLAISFPRDPQDIIESKTLVKQAGSHAKIIAKIERAEAVANKYIMKKMILASDAIMVARGDLGVEIGDSEIIGVQKKLIRYARKLNRVVITATQMMESMINNPMPTRAEVMDVANAVLDGTDAVMLSAETASGKYPSKTVRFMAKICQGAEKIPSINVSKHRLNITFDNIEEALTMSAMYAANHLSGVSAILCMTESGKSALLTSRITSGLPIFALSKNQKTLNLVTLYRGVIPIYFNSKNDGLKVANEAIKLLVRKKFLFLKDLIIFTQGDIMGIVGTTNTIRILQVM